MSITANLEPTERDNFAALADRWWDAEGPCRTLHDINPCRLDYVQRRVDLVGARVADIGCGGGLLSEALARAGSRVTAIDASPELIAVASEHAAGGALDIDYRAMLSAQLALEAAGCFDVVTCMELIEHVPDADALLADCVALLAPGGSLFVSTLNRTPRAYALGIVAAEYLLGLVPRGTHDYARFIRPSELAAAARRRGIDVLDVSGMHYNPLTRRARAGGDPGVNYLVHLRREAAP
ncbi:MAG: bifunctional 2-polyprenyl-6-hydroxyphenol methylase/3-demethylubiquinol 3-O-methyltransferase UbiG [Gammaproteobacteria bacterium]|nr:bifunctional 2-polyprenyl-6-hydroxyphenol methylase/3-demethylubiquinol 3-O-methyltransferase UbiG [Gammaproteobacteria bacterium]MCP5201179.1 bifunctional 2-polyprenyl-6-hydroxyphenol methylase/3-demethylubiquinol 3-O-methyltransferase UbiG [Gammaproteobacteria bacterium]